MQSLDIELSQERNLTSNYECVLCNRNAQDVISIALPMVVCISSSVLVSQLDDIRHQMCTYRHKNRKSRRSQSVVSEFSNNPMRTKTIKHQKGYTRITQRQGAAWPYEQHKPTQIYWLTANWKFSSHAFCSTSQSVPRGSVRGTGRC